MNKPEGAGPTGPAKKGWLAAAVLALAVVAGVGLPYLVPSDLLTPPKAPPARPVEAPAGGPGAALLPPRGPEAAPPGKNKIPEKNNKIPEKKARESLTYKPPAWPEAPDPRGMLLRLGVGTAFVLALCVVALLLGRNWLKKLPASSSTGGRMRVLETLSLGRRCQVHLVRVGRRQVLVGVDPTGLRAVTPLPDAFEEALEEARAEGEGQGAAPGGGAA